MLENIINTIDEFLSQICTDPQIQVKGLAEKVSTVTNGATTAQPKVYSTNGDYTDINLDENCSYHRVLNETPITNAEGLKACTNLMTKTYNMRYVASIPKNLIGSLEDNPYICDKMANTFANVIQNVKFNLIKQTINAASVEALSNGFNTNAFEVFNQEYTNVSYTFPTDRCLIAVDYDLVIDANDDCLLNYFCGQPPIDNLLQICIDNNTCEAILNAINNTTPLEKIDCIRQGISNGFSYCVDFVFFQDDKFFFSEFEGEITSITGTNIFSYEVKVNGVEFQAPFQLNIGDFVSISIVKGDPNTSAELCINAQEFDEQDVTLNTLVEVPKNVDDLALWLDPAAGITLNYQVQTGNLDSVQFSNTWDAGTIATSFTSDDVGKAIRIEQPSGDIDTYITAVNSATQIVTDAAATDTSADNIFYFGRISNIADQANSNDFNQAIAARQPSLKFDVVNGHPVIDMLELELLQSTKNYRSDRTTFMVLKSLETKLTDYTQVFYGDTSTGFLGSWQGERISLGLYQIYGRANSPTGASGGVNTITSPIGTFRNDFNISTFNDREHVLGGEIITDNSLRVGQNVIYTNTATTELPSYPASPFQIGAAGSFQLGSRIQVAEFIVYNRSLEDEEVLYVENYLKNKYQI